MLTFECPQMQELVAEKSPWGIALFGLQEATKLGFACMQKESVGLQSKCTLTHRQEEPSFLSGQESYENLLFYLRREQNDSHTLNCAFIT